MSSRKAKNPRLRIPGWKKRKPGHEARRQVLQQGLAKIMQEEQHGVQLGVPEDEVVQVIKTVDAVVTHPETGEKVRVGDTFIHDDGTVGLKFDEDAPQWAMDLIKLTEQETAYSLETGGFNGIPGQV